MHASSCRRLTGQLTNANTRGTSLDSQLQALRAEYETANQRIRTLEQEKAAVEKELQEIKRTAADVLGINQQNKSLMTQLSDAQIRGDTLEEENRRLMSQTNRYWFMSRRPGVAGWHRARHLVTANSLATAFTLRPLLSDPPQAILQTASPARNIQVSMTVSGFSDMLSMP